MVRRTSLVAIALTAALVHCGGPETVTRSPSPPDPGPGPSPVPATTEPAAVPAGPKWPETPKKPVVNEYHGAKVIDDFQWLENGADPEVTKWSDAQNAYARSVLDALPARQAIADRVTTIRHSSSGNRWALRSQAGGLFAIKSQPPKQQPFLVVMKSADDPGSERIVVDPTVIDPKGSTTIDFYVPSRDGKRVAVSLSAKGTESGDVHVYDVATGKALGDVIPRVYGGTALGHVTWNGDGTGFYYSRYPRAGERPEADLHFYQQVYFHKLGTKESDDRHELGKDFPKIAEVLRLETSEDGQYVLAAIANGDGGEIAFHLRGPAGKWEKIADFTDKVVDAELGADKNIYLVSQAGAPRGKILRVSQKAPALAQAKVIVPESDAVIHEIQVTKSRVYVVDLHGGPQQIRVFSTDGKALAPVPVPPLSSVTPLIRQGGDDVLLRIQSYTEPPAWHRFTAKGDKLSRTALFQTSSVDFGDSEVVREACTSKDGTRIPITILRRKGTKLDGKNPTILYGYGGYRSSQVPSFNGIYRLWLEQGGVFAVANLRGGGELGAEWHRAGTFTRKQNVFDDFAGCARYLIDSGHTRPDRLAIRGGSNGGLLMGAMMTQHPELFRAVVSHVGLYDMLRVELSPNGAFNTTEFGTVKDPEHFKALRAYSPYHNVKGPAALPAALFLTGANDIRVDPYHSRKMTARLQSVAAPKTPILLRTSGDTGHGSGKPLSAGISEDVDVFAFLFHQLGVEYQPIKKP